MQWYCNIKFSEQDLYKYNYSVSSFTIQFLQIFQLSWLLFHKHNYIDYQKLSVIMPLKCKATKHYFKNIKNKHPQIGRQTSSFKLKTINRWLLDQLRDCSAAWWQLTTHPFVQFAKNRGHRHSKYQPMKHLVLISSRQHLLTPVWLLIDHRLRILEAVAVGLIVWMSLGMTHLKYVMNNIIIWMPRKYNNN